MGTILRFVATSAVILMVSSHAVRAQDMNVPLWEMCQIAEPHDLSWEHRWRWRAEQNLSCLIHKLNGRIAAAPGKESAVTISSRELQQLLSLAWGARDAAQRIGR